MPSHMTSPEHPEHFANTPPEFGTAEWYQANTSPLKQMMSPVRYNGDSAMGGLSYSLGTGLPLLSGYMFAYPLSGVGSNSGNWFEKAGIASTENSDRVLGTNYFLPMNDVNGKRMTCSSDSPAPCANKPVFTYMQLYPSEPMGILPAVVDGLTHMNPGMFLDAMYDAWTDHAPTCEYKKLPVGSGLNQCIGNAGYQPAITADPASAPAIYKACMDACSPPSDDTQLHPNCYRACEQIWWEEGQCVPTTSSTVNLTTNQCSRGSPSVDKRIYKMPYGGIKAKGGGSSKSMTYGSVTDQAQRIGAPAPETFVGAARGTGDGWAVTQVPLLWRVVMVVVVLLLGGVVVWRLMGGR